MEPTRNGAHTNQSTDHSLAAYKQRGPHQSRQGLPTCSLHATRFTQVKSRVTHVSARYGVYTSPSTDYSRKQRIHWPIKWTHVSFQLFSLNLAFFSLNMWLIFLNLVNLALLWTSFKISWTWWTWPFFVRTWFSFTWTWWTWPYLVWTWVNRTWIWELHHCWVRTWVQLLIIAISLYYLTLQFTWIMTAFNTRNRCYQLRVHYRLLTFLLDCNFVCWPTSGCFLTQLVTTLQG